MQKRKSHRILDFFLLGMVLFGGLTIWLLNNGYHSDYSLHMWSKILVFSSNDFRLEDSGMLFPYLPFNLFWTASVIPGLHTEYASYLLSVLAAAFLFSHWNSFLVKKGYRINERILLVLLVIGHPFALWGMTSGLNNSMALLAFYLLSFGIVRLVLLRDIHSIMFTSASLMLLFLIDDRSMYLAIVMFPFIPLIAPERMLKESIPSVYVILLTPFMFVFMAWMYLNWLFHNDLFKFMHAPEAMFNGVWQTSDQYAWLNSWGGEWMATLGYTILLSALTIPATIWMVWRYRQHIHIRHTIPKLFFMPAVAATIGTVGFALFHAVDVLYFQVAVLMASLLMLPRIKGKSFNVLAVLLLLGNIGGWKLMYSGDAPQIDTWLNGLAHHVPSSKSDADLAKFINDHPYTTLLDERSGYRVIAAKGNSEKIVFPFRVEVKLMDKYFLDKIDQFATINPRNSLGVVDFVGKRFEGIYWGGWAGYRLVYDDQQWRVYRRNDLMTEKK